MKISAETLVILKNFAGINPSLIFNKGTTQQTISVAKNIFASIKTDTNFEFSFPIYDLMEFISALNMFDDPDISIDGDYLIIADDTGASCKYKLAEPAMIVSPPAGKSPNLSSVDVQFTVPGAVLDKIMKASSSLGLPDIRIRSDNGVIKMGVVDKTTSSSNAFEVPVGTTENEFSVYIQASALRLIPGEYAVEVSKGGYSRWIGTDNGAEYFIVVEKSSTFE